MRNSNLNDRLQIFASVGVLAGLFLVAYEIRQNNNLAEAESIRELFMSWQQTLAAEYETDIASLRIRSFEDPESLTPAEIHKLSAFLSTVTNQLVLDFSMNRRDLGYGGTTLAEQLEANFEYYYGGRFGRAWYMQNREWINPAIVEAMDRLVETKPIESHSIYVDGIKSNL